MERETGIEPATNSLEGCDSTTELLPPFDSLRSLRASLFPLSPVARRRQLPQPNCPTAACATNLLPARQRSTGHSTVAAPREARLAAKQAAPPNRTALSTARAERFGGEGRVRTSVATWAADLQSAAIDRSATSPETCFIFHTHSRSRPVNRPAGVIHERRSIGPCNRLEFRVFGVSLKMRRGPPMELAEGFEPPTG
jgi:hypothetical protein